MELKSLFPKGRPCQREQVGCPDARWSQQVLGGHWGDWGRAGLGFSRCVRPVVVATIPAPLCLLATEHQVPKAFSCKPWGYLRSPLLSFMVRAKAELISRRDLQEIGRQIRWERGGTVGARGLVRTGVPQEAEPSAGLSKPPDRFL